MTRVFDAPRTLVFDAHTKPELLNRWMGQLPGWSWVVCEIDLKVGGSFRYLWRGPNGVEMGMRGVYREITQPERIVNTELFDQACAEAGQGLLLRRHPGYDHSYWFITSFIDDHLRHHAAALGLL